MKQHVDLQTLKLCHLETVKQFSKHFCPILFSNWNSSQLALSHEIVLSRLAFWGAALLLGSLCQPQGSVLSFCLQFASYVNTPWYSFGSPTLQLTTVPQSKPDSRPGVVLVQGSSHTSIPSFPTLTPAYQADRQYLFEILQNKAVFL